MRAALALVACIALSGCVAFPVEGYTWSRARAVSLVAIHVFETTEAARECARVDAPRGSIACAYELPGGDWALIVPPDSPGLLAHEALHALGWNH